jgi:hypothetical protein
MIKDVWKNRYNIREFSNEEIPKEKIDTLVSLFPYIPIQQSIVSHFWILLDPAASDFKNFLFREIYRTRDREHMLPIKSAPYVFLSVISDKVAKGDDKPTQHHNVGLHAGVLLSEALNMDLNVSCIRCTEGRSQTNHKEFNERLINYIDKEKLKKYLPKRAELHELAFSPSIAVCIGKGLPLRSQPIEKRDGYKVFTGRKKRKPFSNIELTDDQI